MLIQIDIFCRQNRCVEEFCCNVAEKPAPQQSSQIETKINDDRINELSQTVGKKWTFKEEITLININNSHSMYLALHAFKIASLDNYNNWTDSPQHSWRVDDEQTNNTIASASNNTANQTFSNLPSASGSETDSSRNIHPLLKGISNSLLQAITLYARSEIAGRYTIM